MTVICVDLRARDIYTFQMASLICPVCERNDLLQKIGPIIDSGITDSDAQITGVATGWNVGFASLSGVNVSRLASRLSGPTMPRLSPIQNYLVGALIGFVITLNYTPSWVTPTGISYFLGFQKEALILSIFLGVLSGFFLKLPVQSITNVTFLRNQRRDWKLNRARLRNEYYCLRDDAIIYDGEAYSVENYLEWCFSLKNSNSG